MKRSRGIAFAAETEAFVRTEVPRWIALVRKAGITPE